VRQIDGTVTYEIPQGERRGIDVDLTDATYDGIIDGQRLSGGLGQLTDGELGQSNFRAVERRGTAIKASHKAFRSGICVETGITDKVVEWLGPIYCVVYLDSN